MKKILRNDLIIRAIQQLLWLFAVSTLFFGIFLLFSHDPGFSINIDLIRCAFHGIHFGLQIDFLSVVLLGMVSVLAASIARYSDRYLSGERRKFYFYQYLLFTTLSVSLLILSNNLAMLFLMWLSTSYGLHRLLTFYPERPLAVQAARKKFLISRLGDALLLLAIIFTFHLFGTLDFNLIFEKINFIKNNAHSSFSLIAVLFVIGAMTKSAQFPFHFWLPETMETPTPVSAFMHAGIINAGGFLMIRLNPLISASEPAQFLLAVMGAWTASFGAVVMITQNDIKKKLAYSTISQMGMMMFACGLGLYSIALFHIIAHSFYKSHAFLSTGFLVKESKKVKLLPKKVKRADLVFTILTGCLIVVVGVLTFNASYLGYFTYGAVLWLGLMQSFHFDSLGVKFKFRFYIQIMVALFVAFLLCVLIEFGIHHAIAAWISMSTARKMGVQILSCVMSYGCFVIGFWLSTTLIESKNNSFKKLYFYFWHGGYFIYFWAALGKKEKYKNHSSLNRTRTNIAPTNTSGAIAQSLQMVAPSWPLQNAVAVNPFWFLRSQKFDESLKKLSMVFNDGLYMPLSYYRNEINQGRIDQSSLEQALKQYSTHSSVNEFLKKLDHDSDAKTMTPHSLSQYLGQDSDQFIHSHFHQYCAAYFDDQQALAKFPWQEEHFWRAWLEAQQLDLSLSLAGVHGFKEALQGLYFLEPMQAIEIMLFRMGIVEMHHQVFYMQKLLASALGWASAFQYLEWQRSLGHEVKRTSSTLDLLAVRMAYDYALVLSGSCGAAAVDEWMRTLKSGSLETHLHLDHSSLNERSILQLALEYAYQNKLAKKLASKVKNNSDSHPAVKAQMVFCIDVRSEPLRRNIEIQIPCIKTIGFAGFFGTPFCYTNFQESKPSHHYPVLLKPAFQVKEVALASEAKNLNHKFLINQVFGYFKNLRKSPFSSFLYVELFGALYVETILRMNLTRIPKRFDSKGTQLEMRPLIGGSGSQVSINEKIDRAESVLKHMGLTTDFAEMIFIVGHGSETTNNAFGSTLECGACGGHSGEINARVLSHLLNEAEIRLGLKARGIEIPIDTMFVPAIHETVTDEIYFLDAQNIPEGKMQQMNVIREQMIRASAQTRSERQNLRTLVPAPLPNRRSANWSETRPEWGLAGNASFIVAPRERTLSIDLEGRSFLHDYDWKKDQQATNFQNLELIMTAPMIVTNWINLQYFASVTQPRIYGSGNKVLHNLVNESGVLEGNGGDLRIGLPLQSIHDGEKFVHEPLRLSVLIEAPRVEIEKIISKHQVVSDLVNNGWMHLLQIEPESGKLFRRVNRENYVAVIQES